MSWNQDPDWNEFVGAFEFQTAKALRFEAFQWSEASFIPKSQMEVWSDDEGAWVDWARLERAPAAGEELRIRIKGWLCKKNGWGEL